MPRRTARLRLTALYGGLFLLSGVALVAATYVLFQRATALGSPRLPRIPRTTTIRSLGPPTLPQAFSAVATDQKALSLQLIYSARVGRKPLLPLPPQLVRAERQLAQARRQLARAERQVVQAGAVEAAQRSADSRRLLVDSGVALAVVGVLALLAGWLVAGRMLRPIRTITRAARRISSTSLHERLALDGPEDELKELGDTLDDLFARLEAAFEAQRHFVANASHELRTPLTRERALVQVALGDPSTPELWRSTGQALLESNRDQEALIEALLALASSESELDRREWADLAEICAAVVARLEPEAERSGLRLETTLGTAPLTCDPRLVERLVANLFENAVGHNVAGGSVRVATESAHGAAVLTVANTGPVVPATEVDRLFQPFQRLDPRLVRRAGGHGLGLSIVRAIANAHGASVAARPLPDGGLSVRVAFPPA